VNLDGLRPDGVEAVAPQPLVVSADRDQVRKLVVSRLPERGAERMVLERLVPDFRSDQLLITS
jgi:hypothetical protein